MAAVLAAIFGTLLLFPFVASAGPTDTGPAVSTPVTAGGPRGETWAWNGTNWKPQGSLLSPGPSPRFNASLVYDGATQKTVLFGGMQTPSAPLGDTWLWNGTGWTQANPATSPPGRGGA